MKKTLALATAASAFLATSALAADLPTISEPAPYIPAPVFTWDGFYVGANVGYAWGDADGSVLGIPVVSSSGFDGVIGGLQAGYNAQFGQVVVGLETDIQLSGVSDSGDIGGGVILKSDLEWFGTTRARLGFAFDRFLPYVTGGVAYGQNKVSITGLGSNSKSHLGWTIGAGLEAAFTENLSAKVEYLYVDFDGKNYFSGVLPAPLKIDSSLHIARVGLNYRF